MAKQSGHTLLELLIVLSLIGLIVLIVGGSMRLGFRSVEKGEKKIESLERFKVSLNIVDSQIQSFIPLVSKDSDPAVKAKDYLFSGDSESIKFPTNYSIWSDNAGYVMVAYRVETDGNGKQSLSATENTIGQEVVRQTRLFDMFDRIYFEYFFLLPPEEKGKWLEQWTDTPVVPEKIKFHLVNGRNHLSFIIPIRVRQFTNNKRPSL